MSRAGAVNGGRPRGAGELAIVLHTHMPYVEGFGTWPFGEEWLWEAIATVYLPLLDVLECGAPVTLSATPVLCDQLAADGVGERFATFMRDVRRASHREDIEGLRAAGGEGEVLARELERAAGDYERALERFEQLDGDVLGALAPHVQWTSSATHAVLPLLATDAGARLQIESGIAAHRARFGAGWRGGFWLPECAYAGWLDPLLARAGVRATCVDLTDVLGYGAAGQLQPVANGRGPLLVPIDRATIELVWSESGYPADPRYRDYHHHTIHHHTPWANGGQPYDHAAALAAAREHAADFVARTRTRIERASAELGARAVVVCALDTELLGHWWYEGIAWLDAVVAEAARQGLELVRLDDALDRCQPAPAPAAGVGVTSWGSPRDLSTWDGPAAAELAWAARAAELRVVAAGPAASEHAIRELLALQSSDWAFMTTRELARPYAAKRAHDHGLALDAALRSIGSGAAGVRNLAPHASPASLLAP